jgi:mannose-6-phosphate isomerase
MSKTLPSSYPPPHVGVKYLPGEQGRRPWGSWEVVAVGPRFTLKKIELAAGERLSLQYHEFRSEHWTIVEGLAEVEIDGKVRTAEAGDHLFIPIRACHRIKNAGRSLLTFIEVQMGDLLDEGDIVRLGDDYGRA